MCVKPSSTEHPDHSFGARKIELPAPVAGLLLFGADGDEVGLTSAPHHSRILPEHVPMRLGPGFDFVQAGHVTGAEPVRYTQVTLLGHAGRVDGERDL